MSLESLFPEDWVLSNVLSSSDLYGSKLHGNLTEGDGGCEELWKADLRNQMTVPDDTKLGDDFVDTFSIGWLNKETSCITNLDPSLHDLFLNEPDDPVADALAEFESIQQDLDPSPSFDHTDYVMKDEPSSSPVDGIEEYLSGSPLSGGPSSPVEAISIDQIQDPVVKFVQPSTIDTSGLLSGAQIVMSDMNVLHLPEAHGDEAGLILLDALTKPGLTVQLPVDEMESLLSSPPSSPEALVPNSTDDEFTPSRKRKATSNGGSTRSLKSLKPSEKKARKKIQNKNAATKYRIKKRMEDEEVKGEVRELETSNSDLKRQVEDLSSEIVYMKGLLNEILKGKGLKIM